MSAVLPIDKYSTILDIGCGTGRTLIDLCISYGCRGMGIDLSDAQIKDAEIRLQKINKKRMLERLPVIKIEFIRASGSDLKKSLNNKSLFSHVISQDAIFLVEKKQSLFKNIYDLLTPKGVVAIADFLSESATKLTKNEKELVYELVNWNEGLSFITYKTILQAVGFSIKKNERRDLDMIMTYKKLGDKMEKYVVNKDRTYTNLGDRYKNIVSTVESGKMGWGFFIAQK